MAIEAVKSVTQNYQAQSQASKASVAQTTKPTSVKTATEAEKVQLQNISLESSDNETQIANQNEQIKKAVSDLNRKMNDTSCQFGIHEATNRVTIKIIDNNTKEVIREYPAEETMKMIEKAWELAGIMVDEKL